MSYLLSAGVADDPSMHKLMYLPFVVCLGRAVSTSPVRLSRHELSNKRHGRR